MAFALAVFTTAYGWVFRQANFLLACNGAPSTPNLSRRFACDDGRGTIYRYRPNCKLKCYPGSSTS
eukprot:2233056-Pyramimonas_sp.AAC.1